LYIYYYYHHYVLFSSYMGPVATIPLISLFYSWLIFCFPLNGKVKDWHLESTVIFILFMVV